MAISTSSDLEFVSTKRSSVAPAQGFLPPNSRTRQFISNINASIEHDEACANIANETRAVLRCDRVSVLGKSHGSFRLQSISGQPSVNRRSNTTQLLETLANKVLRTGTAFRYPGNHVAPQVEQSLQDYLTQSTVRTLIIEPVFERPESTQDENDQLSSNQVIGGIVIEHIQEEWSIENHRTAIGFALEHASISFRNAYRHQSLFLYSLWHWLGKSKVLASPKLIPKTMLAALALFLFGLFLAFWPTQFYVVSEGVIVPEHSRNIFCQADGIVDQVFVSHGDTVAAGDVICKLKSDNLDFRQQELEGRISQLEERLTAIRGDRFDFRSQNVPATQTENIKSLEAQLKSYQNQRGILNQMAEQLVVRSPIAGQILTWDPSAKLADRPVQNGEQLFQIADVNAGWQLELDLADRRIGHVLRAVDRADSGKVPVSFLLAADPSKRLQGKIKEVALTTEIISGNAQVIKLQVEIDENSLPVKHAHTGVTAKIICGRSSVGYLWLHDLGEFLNKHLLFRFAS